MLAAKKGHRYTVQGLIEPGANLSATDATGKTALALAQEGDFTDIVEALSKAGAT
jgi:ankyrin repeat protein